MSNEYRLISRQRRALDELPVTAGENAQGWGNTPNTTDHLTGFQQGHGYTDSGVCRVTVVSVDIEGREGQGERERTPTSLRQRESARAKRNGGYK